jgi:hypothetical protein
MPGGLPVAGLAGLADVSPPPQAASVSDRTSAKAVREGTALRTVVVWMVLIC